MDITDIDVIKTDPQYFIDEYFAPLINEIDLYYEQLEVRNDIARMKLIDQIIDIKNYILKKCDYIKDIDDIDDIKTILRNCSEYKLFFGKIFIRRVIPNLTPNIVSYLFNYTDINTEVMLKCSSITYIQFGSFDTFTNITILTLCFNNLIDLSPGIFDKLTLLKQLHISCNSIHKIQSYLFDKLINLEVLNISSNKLEQIHQLNLPNLVGLHLGNNKISHIDRRAFNNLVSL